jgi:hypothetical protein
MADRTFSGLNNQINEISDKIKESLEHDKEQLSNLIFYYIKKSRYPLPYKIDIEVKDSGSYINLNFPRNHEENTYLLTFVCHKTTIDKKGNRMHCKVYKNNVEVGYSGVILDIYEPNPFVFKEKGLKWEQVHENIEYFYAIFNAINTLYYVYGGKKNNIKNNFNNYNVSELKNICRTYKIKNYSKLNKADLISLIKKNKKLLK